jgi:quinol monooxygenase YgiN
VTVADHVIAITQIHGIAGRRSDLRELMRAAERRTAAEPGCVLYRFTAALDQPDKYVHVQEWASEDAWRAHQTSPAFRDYQQGLFELLARPSEMKIHRHAETTIPEPSGPPDPRTVD